MSLARRVEKAEAANGAQACPCRTPRRIEIVNRPRSDESRDAGSCTSCGSPRPVRIIEAVRPEGVSV